MTLIPDSDWYFEHALRDAVPLDERTLRPTETERWNAWWDARPTDTPLAAQAAAQGWVLTTAQLRDLGHGDVDRRRLTRREQLWSPARGVVSPIVAPGDDWSARRRRHALQSTAAALLRPGHVVDGRSSAILHGLPTTALPERSELGATTTAGRRHRAHVHAATIIPADVTRWFGCPVTSVARTVVDLGRRDADDAIMAADAALRAGTVTRGQLQAALVAAAGWPGVQRAREVVALADVQAESPLESVTRLRLHDSGFPPPQLQFRLAGYLVDLAWPEFGVLLECDGRDKYSGDALWRERRREGVLRHVGRRWQVDRVVWFDVNGGWTATCARLAGLFPAGVVISRRKK